MNDTAEPIADGSASYRLTAATVEDRVLGGVVRLELGARWTVLVGKNGAGKSRLLEDLHDAAFAAINLVAPAPPRLVKLELDLGGAPLEYTYTCLPTASKDREDRMSWDWQETATDPASGREMWRSANGVGTIGAATEMAVPPMIGLLHLYGSFAGVPFPPQIEPLRDLLLGVRLVRAGVPRHAPARELLRLQGTRAANHAAKDPSPIRWTGRGDYRLIEVIKTLVSWSESEPARLATVIEIGRRLQVLRAITVELDHIKPGPASELEAEVFVDGVNFGYLSDGTQRLIELVVRLVDPAVRVLLLEEPETSVHPGLLRRLLAELDALPPGRQVVISTHSPLVLDAAQGEEVRLVERSEAGVTSVRSLSADEQERLRHYLDDDLELSDFVFSGALD